MAVRGRDQARLDLAGAGLVANGELFYLAALELDQPGIEALALLRRIGGDGPVFAGLEGLDLQEVEAHQIVQGPPRLLSVDQVRREFPGVGHRLLDGALGDLVENHPVNRPLAELAAFFEQLVAGNGLDVLLIALDDLILHGEAMVGVHRPLLGYQIADMTVGGHHVKIRAQILFDGFGLGRRFDDDQIHTVANIRKLLGVTDSPIPKLEQSHWRGACPLQ